MKKVKFLWVLLMVTAGLDAQPEPGIVHDTVRCMHDPGETYALYLPSGYTDSVRWPVVYIFEPGARGAMAVDTFREAGERFGTIMLCSNNASNRSLESSQNAAAAMFRDASERFSIDTGRVFVSGFSGGSRVAVNLAIGNPGIKGVIACGAGLLHNPEAADRLPGTFFYYGIVGRRDMNLSEMIQTGELLKASGLKYHIQYTDIRHVWPHADEITAALAWLLCQSDPADVRAREAYLQYQYSRVGSLTEQGRWLDAAGRLEPVLEQFPDPSGEALLEDIRGRKEYRKQVRQRKRAYAIEADMRADFLKALTNYVYATPARPDTVYTPAWWDSEIRQLRKWSDSEKREYEWMADRLSYTLEVHFSEDIGVYQSDFQMQKALFLCDLWLKVSPDGLWSQWTVASVLVATGKFQEAIGLIEHMIGQGIAERDWFLEAPEFEALQGEPRFMKLVS